MSLRKHDWIYGMDLAKCWTRYHCSTCNATKVVHRDGRVTYSTYQHTEETPSEPCCTPPFDPDISLEDLARAGYVPKIEP